MIQIVTAPAASNDLANHVSVPESVVVIDLTGIELAAAAPDPSRGCADSARVGPKPRTTKPQMLQAFRQLRHQRVQHDEETRVLHSIIEASGPESLGSAIRSQTA